MADTSQLHRFDVSGFDDFDLGDSTEAAPPLWKDLAAGSLLAALLFAITVLVLLT